MSNVDPVAEAQAEIAKAEADLAAAEQEKATLAASQQAPPPAEATVRIGTTSPWNVYVTDDGQRIPFDGIDVPATLAERLLAAVPGLLIRKDDSAR